MSLKWNTIFAKREDQSKLLVNLHHQQHRKTRTIFCIIVRREDKNTRSKSDPSQIRREDKKPRSKSDPSQILNPMLRMPARPCQYGGEALVGDAAVATSRQPHDAISLARGLLYTPHHLSPRHE